MALTGKPIETYEIEYRTVFTSDKKSATDVAKTSASLLKSLEGQDARYTSIVNKMKELAGSSGANAYTAQMEKAGIAAKNLEAQVAKINQQIKDSPTDSAHNTSLTKLVRLRKEMVVEMAKLDKLQAKITAGAKEEVRVRATRGVASPTSTGVTRSGEDALLAKEAAATRKLAAETEYLNGTFKAAAVARNAASVAGKELNTTLNGEWAAANNAAIATKKLEAAEKERQVVAAMQRNTTVPLSKELEHQIAVTNELTRLDKARLLANDKTLNTKRQAIAIEKAMSSEANKQSMLDNKELQAAKTETTLKSQLLSIERKITLEGNKQLQDAKTALAVAAQKNNQVREKATHSKENFGFGTGGNTTFAHKIGTTLQYSAAAAGIYAVTGALREGAAAIVEYDTSYRTLSAVINDLSLPDAAKLEDKLIDLGKAYGGTLSGINEAAILLGRAGIAHQDLAKATEITIKLAKLTGDTLEVSSGAMITYLEVYKESGETVESLGDKLAFMANESRLSTLDIETFSNYALASANAAGLSADAVSALATQYSKAGVNASTIGTQIRSLTKTFLDGSKGVKSFFADLGIVQGNFQAELAAGGERSNAALVALSKKLADLTREEFNSVTANMNILQRNSLALLRQQSEGIADDIKTLTSGTHEGIRAADKILAGHVVTWEKFKVTVADVGIELDKAVGASKFFANALEQVTAILGDEWGGYAKIAEIQTIRKEQEILGIRLSKERATAAKAQSEETIKATGRIVAGTKAEIQLLQQKINVIKSIEQEETGLATLTKQELDNRKAGLTSVIKKEKVHLKALEDKRKVLREADGSKEDLTIANKAISKSKKLIDNYKVSVEDVDKAFLVLDGTVAKTKDKIGSIKPPVQDVRNLTSAVIELFKAQKIDEAVALKPFAAIDNQIGIIQTRIDKLSKDNDKDGEIFAGINISATDTVGILQARAEITNRLLVLQDKGLKLSKDDLAVNNAKRNTLSALDEQLDLALGLAKEKTKVNNAELSAIDKVLTREISKSQEYEKQSGLLRIQKIDQNDKVAVAEAQAQIARTISDISMEAAITEKTGLKAVKDMTAARQADLNVIKVRQTLAQSQLNTYNKQSAALLKQKDSITFMNGIQKQRNDLDTAHEENLKKINIQFKNFDVNHPQRLLLIEQENALYQKQLYHIEEVNQATVQSIDAFSSSMVTLLSDTSMGIQDSRAVWESLQSTITNTIIQLLVMEPILNSIKAAMDGTASSGINFGSTLMSFIGGFTGSSTGTPEYGYGDDTYTLAKGGVYSSGNITAFASGGVVQSPTFFPNGSSGTGLMGEAGPEAIVPLTRVKGGDLGVKAQQPIVNVEVINNAGANVNVQQDEAGKLQVIIESVTNSIASGIARGTSPVGDSIQATYGVTR